MVFQFNIILKTHNESKIDFKHIFFHDHCLIATVFFEMNEVNENMREGENSAR